MYKSKVVLNFKFQILSQDAERKAIEETSRALPAPEEQPTLHPAAHNVRQAGQNADPLFMEDPQPPVADIDSAEPSDLSAPKRGRGRPKGSGNKKHDAAEVLHATQMQSNTDEFGKFKFLEKCLY
jgi:hypothetical protein